MAHPPSALDPRVKPEGRLFHFTPTSSSWLNAVEGFFAKLTDDA